jgi:hypothetical protein
VESSDLLVDAFGRVRDSVHGVVDGASPELLTYRVDEDANTIGWLVWHLTRVQDDHVADAAGIEQVWTSGGWAERFGLPFGHAATGFGHSSDDVAAVRPAAEDLAAYHDAVYEQTLRYIRRITDEDLDAVIDSAWDPPVTLGVRLVSVIGDDTQHVGQAAFIRGLAQRTGVS